MPSSDKRVARLEPAGCTAWIATSRSLIFTSGHCGGKIAQIVEFNVPFSNPDGSKNHPPPQDQYPLTRNLGGISNPNACDWAVYEVGINGTNKTPLQNQGAYFRLATKMPSSPSTLRITGHGMHLTNKTWNQVQKTVTGPYVGMGSGKCGPYLVLYQVDSISGDSGSPVIHEGNRQPTDERRGDVVRMAFHLVCYPQDFLLRQLLPFQDAGPYDPPNDRRSAGAYTLLHGYTVFLMYRGNIFSMAK